MTSTLSKRRETLHAHWSSRPLPWLMLWAILAIAEILLLADNAHLDSHLWLSTRDFIAAHPNDRLWEYFKIIGNPWFTAAVVLLMVVFSCRRFLIAPAAIIATALAGGIGGLIAITAGRVRPLTDGVNTWELFRGFHVGAKNIAFPSGHATLAFATAAVVIYFFPKAKWIALPLAAACAFSRVAQGAHFYSDILFGAVLGWTIAWWTCHLIHQRFAIPHK